MVSVQDDFAPVENGRAAEAVHAGEWAGSRHPPLAAGVIIRRHEHPVAIQERDIDELTIGCGRAGGETVKRMFAFPRRTAARPSVCPAPNQWPSAGNFPPPETR